MHFAKREKFNGAWIMFPGNVIFSVESATWTVWRVDKARVLHVGRFMQQKHPD